MENCCEGVLWRSVVPHKMKRSDVEKCCGEVLWRSVVRKCCREVLWGSVVEKCCEEVLSRSFVVKCCRELKEEGATSCSRAGRKGRALHIACS